jgi:hypothetical protein
VVKHRATHEGFACFIISFQIELPDTISWKPYFHCHLFLVMSSSTRRQQPQQEGNEQSINTQQQQREQHEATIRSIDETKGNIRRSIEETRRELPRYSQTVTDFQNETADASVEIADNFLESQKEVITSMQSAWAPMAERMGHVAQNWTTGMMTPFFSYFSSPQEMADVYTRTIGAMAEAYVASTRMATNMIFAGMEVTRATTNFTRQNAKEAARITSNSARSFAQNARETVQVQGEGQQGENRIAWGGSNSVGGRGAGSTANSFDSQGGNRLATTTASLANEGTTTLAPSSETSFTSTTETGSGSTESTTAATSSTAEKTRKK